MRGYALQTKVLFPRLFFYAYIESSNPKKTKKAPHHRHQTQSTENPNPKNPIQDPNPKTTTNEQKWEKRITLGKIEHKKQQQQNHIVTSSVEFSSGEHKSTP